MANFLVRLIALIILAVIGLILYPLGAIFWFIGAIGYIVEKVCLTTGKGLFKGVNEAISGLWKEMTGTSSVQEAFEEVVTKDDGVQGNNPNDTTDVM